MRPAFTTTLRSQVSTLALLIFGTFLVSGCGSDALKTGISDPAIVSGPHLKGSTFGGQQPISRAVVQLWAVGTPSTGGAYGAGQSALILSTVTSFADGSFTITDDYKCPTNGFVYITSTGGDPGGGTNSAAVLMAALGACSDLTENTFININEATTVAGVFALQQFATATFGTAGSFSVGAPSTNVVGLQNAFAAANNLVNITTGQNQASTTVANTINGSTVSIVVTSEAAKIGQLANILAYCINSNDKDGGALSDNCTTLFAAVQPAGQTSAAVDTLQAVLDIARNPTNVGSTTTAPFDLVSTIPPFVPNLGSTPPNDWTLGLSYTSATTLGTPAYSFLKTGYQLAIDSVGNIYVLNGPGSTSGNSVGVVSPAGKAVGSLLSGSTLVSPRGIALDTNDNVWVANNGSATNSLVEYTTGGTVNTFTSPAVLYGIAISGNNDIFVSEPTSDELLELAGGAGTLANVTGLGSAGESIAIDSSENVWVSNSASASVTEAKFACTTPPCTFASKVSFTGLTNTFGIAIDQNSIPWVSNASTTNKITELNPAAPTSGGTSSAAGLGGLDTPEFIAMDGASNLWAPNSNAGGPSVTEIAAGSTTTALSPSTGFTHTYATPRSVAIDSSGNVWVVNSMGSSTAPILTEIVGAAVPVATPLSKAIALGKVGQLP